MSEQAAAVLTPNDEPIITAPKKVKDPKRVAAGKRLAEINKEAKARKKALAEEVTPYIDGESEAGLAALAGLALTAMGTYYGYKTYWSTSFARSEDPQSLEPASTKPLGSSIRPVLDSLE